MGKRGPEFYDESNVFDTYTAHRARPESPNETIEQPILWELIGNPGGLAVLDLGCGDARTSKRFRDLGAKSYIGVEGSRRMFDLAQMNVDHEFSKVVHSWMEDYFPSGDSFDLVVSSLAFHYVEDFRALMAKVAHGLRAGGRLVFSVEHPVITSCNRALDDSAVRQAWIVDDYFVRGARSVRWMGDMVTKYHRTIEDILTELTHAGLTVENFRESDPPRDCFEDEALWKRRRRIPLFLIIGAKKK